jgi:large subunit ribosomal protein L18
LTAASSNQKKLINTKGTKIDQAIAVGKSIAENAKSVGVESVVFDRGGFLYHGRVKALAESARETGLKF